MPPIARPPTVLGRNCCTKSLNKESAFSGGEPPGRTERGAGTADGARSPTVVPEASAQLGLAGRAEQGERPVLHLVDEDRVGVRLTVRLEGDVLRHAGQLRARDGGVD